MWETGRGLHGRAVVLELGLGESHGVEGDVEPEPALLGGEQRGWLGLVLQGHPDDDGMQLVSPAAILHSNEEGGADAGHSLGLLEVLLGGQENHLLGNNVAGTALEPRPSRSCWPGPRWYP